MSPQLAALLGGSALLVYVVEELSKNVQFLAGSRFRGWVNELAKNRLSGMLLGTVLSLLLSSSSVVTVMLVGLANAELLSLAQVFSVSLGASIGTTFIAQVFAFRIAEYALLLVAIGVIMNSFSESDRFFHLGRSLLYLGLMFYAMTIVRDAGIQLENDELFKFIINYFKDRPIVSLFIAAGFTALMRSSAATIAFVMSLMAARHGTIHEAVPWVLGANLGTSATAYFASINGGVLGKQAALGQLLCKVVGIAIAFPIMGYLCDMANYLAPGDVSRQIAHSHTLFNVFVAIIFFPFIGVGVKLVRWMIPDRDNAGSFRFLYLDPRSLNTPELALAQAQRELLRLSDAVEQMVERSILLFNTGSTRELESIKAMDQVVDFLNKGIKLYLTKLSQNEMTPRQVQHEFEILLRTNDLENIGDIVDKNILELVRKNIKKGYTFSREGWAEITSFHQKVVEILRISTAYFNTRDRAIFSKVLVLHQEIEDLMIDLSEQHVQRLHRGVKETLSTTSVHLDLLGYLLRIAALAVNFTKARGLKNAEDPSTFGRG